MTLIVEDGTNVAGAESYATTAYADTYHSALGNTAWAALTTAAKEQNLRKAALYMMQAYRSRWGGSRQYRDQSLDWPRASVPIRDYGGYYDVNYIPPAVSNACASLALRASTATLSADLTQAKTSVTVGPISTSYDPFSPQAKRYPEIDAMLEPFLTSASVAVRR